MNKRQVFVVPNKSGGANSQWQVKLTGKPNPISNHRKKETAMETAKSIASKLKTERVALKRNGIIGGKESFGNESKTIDREH
jgi:hypothetical protein